MTRDEAGLPRTTARATRRSHACHDSGKNWVGPTRSRRAEAGHGLEFLDLAPRVPVRTEVQTFRLAEANEALTRLRNGEVRGGAVVLLVGDE